MTLNRFESALTDLIDERTTDYNNARRAQQKTNIDQEAREALAAAQATQEALDALDVPPATADAEPPAPPTGVIATRDEATGFGLIEYAPASTGADEWVRSAEVRFRKIGNANWTVLKSDIEFGSGPLDLAPQNIIDPTDSWQAQARFFDHWGRASAWAPTTPVTAVIAKYIPYLRADYIRAGDIQAGDISVLSRLIIKSGGELLTGLTNAGDPGSARTRLGSTGLELSPLTNINAIPSDGETGRRSSITPMTSLFAHYTFFDSSAQGQRGMTMRASGSGSYETVIRLNATSSEALAWNHGRNSTLSLYSAGAGGVGMAEFHSNVRVLGSLYIDNTLQGSNVIGSGNIDNGALHGRHFPNWIGRPNRNQLPPTVDVHASQVVGRFSQAQIPPGIPGSKLANKSVGPKKITRIGWSQVGYKGDDKPRLASNNYVDQEIKKVRNWTKRNFRQKG